MINRLGSLPPEIRTYIYSFVFATAQGGLISLLVEKNGDWANYGGLPPISVLRRSPRYIAYRQKQNSSNDSSNVWPDQVEDAFLQGMQRSVRPQSQSLTVG